MCIIGGREGKGKGKGREWKGMEWNMIHIHSLPQMNMTDLEKLEKEMSKEVREGLKEVAVVEFVCFSTSYLSFFFLLS